MPSRVLAGIIVGAAAVLGAFALVHRDSLAFTLGVAPSVPAAQLHPGQVACQAPIDVPADFDRLALAVGTDHGPGSALAVTVRDIGGRTLAQGRLAADYPDIVVRQLEQIRLDRAVSAPRIAVCVRNVGTGATALYGNGDAAARTSTIALDGHPANADITLRFARSSRSLASMSGEIVRRAALFRFAGMPPWIYMVLGLALVCGGPFLLLRALRGALTWPADER